MLPNRNQAVPRSLRTLFHDGSLTSLTDGQLLERFAARDGEAAESAFAALVERHGPLVWRTCRDVLRDDHDAADAFQATFLVLVRKASSLWVRDSIGPWLHRVCLRTAVHAKKDRIRRRAAEQHAAELAPAWSEPSGADDVAQIVHQELDRLPERYRIPLVLCELEGRSHEEAARQLGCPVGTVKSRLARGRERLKNRLNRRGINPSSDQLALLTFRTPTAHSLAPALTDSTIRAAVSITGGALKTAYPLSASSLALAEGVLKVMLRDRAMTGVASLVAIIGLTALGWFAHAGQGVVRPEKIPAPPVTEKTAGDPTVDLQGNWIVRGYPSGQAFGLIAIEGQQPRLATTLLSVTRPELYHFRESTIEKLRVDEEAVGFTLRLKAIRPVDSRAMDVIAYLPKDEASPKALWGSMEFDTQGQYPVKLERTDLKELNPRETVAPGNEDLLRFNQAKDRGKRKEILEGILKQHGETPIAPFAAWALAINQAQAQAPEAEVRAAVERAIGLAARYGPEMEVEAINVIVRNLVGMEELEDLVLEYARKAESMLRRSDSIALQTSVLKNLATALRKAKKIDETRSLAEVLAVEARLAKLSPPAGEGIKPAAPTDRRDRVDAIPWARNFAAARKEAAAKGKLMMVDFFTQTCHWCKRLDADVFPKSTVVEAMRPFVPVKVDAHDGEGRPLVEQYQAHIQGYPAILFIDPTIEDPHDAHIVGKIPGYAPAMAFVQLLDVIDSLPKDLSKLREHHREHPDDIESLRQMATSLAMQGEIEQAIELAGRAHENSSAPNADRWAAVYNTLGDELLLRQKLSEAAEWYGKASRSARRPIDVYNARVGAAFIAALQRKTETAAVELEAAARISDLSSSERDFARELLGLLAKPVKSSDGA